MCRASPVSGDRGTISTHRADSSAARSGYPSAQHASTEHAEGKFPVKWAVSTTTACTTPGAPSRTIAQSCSSAPGSRPRLASAPRRRRVSHPSYSCPLCPKVCGENVGALGLIRFSFSAKNSSEAAITDPRSAREARSGRSSGSAPSDVKQPASPRKQPPARRVERGDLDPA